MADIKVKIGVDTTEAVRDLKALQRVARETVRALKELEEMRVAQGAIGDIVAEGFQEGFNRERAAGESRMVIEVPKKKEGDSQ